MTKTRDLADLGGGFIQAGTGATQRTVEDKLNDVVSVKDFGAVGDGTTDDTSAIQAALNSGSKHIFAPSGTYLLSNYILIPDGVSLSGGGQDVTTFKAATSAAPSGDVKGWISKIGSQPTAIANLASNVSKGGRTLTFAAAHGLSAGDLVLIYNSTDSSFNSYRTVYRAGEYCEVLSITSSTVVELRNPLCDDYNAADVGVYTCSGYINGNLSDFSITGNGYQASNDLLLQFCKGVNVHNVSTTGSNHSSAVVDKSYGTDLKGMHCVMQWDGVTDYGTFYGLSISNSQQVSIQGTFKSRRHAITHGGNDDWSVPCRFSHTYDSELESDPVGLAPAYDTHGNAEYCTVDGITAKGGFSLGGDHIAVRNSSFIGSETAQGLCQYAEMHGFNFTVENVYVETYYSDSNRGLLDVGGNSTSVSNAAKTGGTFIVRNLTLVAPNQTTFGIVFRNRGAVQDYDLLFDNVSYEANLSSVTYGPIRVDTVTGNSPDRIQATNVIANGISNYPSLSLGSVDLSNNPLIRQDSLTGKLQLTVTSGTKFAAGSPTNFVKRFAKAPSMATAIEVGVDSAGTIFVPTLYSSPTASNYRLAIRGAANASATTNFTIHWTATLQEF